MVIDNADEIKALEWTATTQADGVGIHHSRPRGVSTYSGQRRSTGEGSQPGATGPPIFRPRRVEGRRTGRGSQLPPWRPVCPSTPPHPGRNGGRCARRPRDASHPLVLGRGPVAGNCPVTWWWPPSPHWSNGLTRDMDVRLDAMLLKRDWQDATGHKMAERAGFEPARSWWPLRDFQSRPFVHSGTSPAGHRVESASAFTENWEQVRGVGRHDRSVAKHHYSQSAF